MEDLVNKYPNLYAEMKVIGAEFMAEYREEQLAQSLSQRASVPDSMAPEIIADDHVIHLVFSLAYYWYYVENGRRPGLRPPLHKIIDWVERTGLAEGKDISVKSLAFLIARKIGNEGTKGKHVVQTVVARNAERWIERCRIAAIKDVNTRVRLIFSKLGKA